MFSHPSFLRTALVVLMFCNVTCWSSFLTDEALLNKWLNFVPQWIKSFTAEDWNYVCAVLCFFGRGDRLFKIAVRLLGNKTSLFRSKGWYIFCFHSEQLFSQYVFPTYWDITIPSGKTAWKLIMFWDGNMFLPKSGLAPFPWTLKTLALLEVSASVLSLMPMRL